MLRNLEDEFRVYPPYWYYRARTAQESGSIEEARRHYAEFSRVWRPVLRRDPYPLGRTSMLEAAKFRVQDTASSGQERPIDDVRESLLDQLEVIYSNTPKDDP